MDAIAVRLKSQIAECDRTCRTMTFAALRELAETDSLASLLAQKELVRRLANDPFTNPLVAPEQATNV